jgi:glycosyltransferase involved in cell wall biosynthesis
MTAVSIIVPCFNERSTIHLLLDAIYAQTYPRAEMETIITDGGSTDGTREAIGNWQSAHPDFKLSVVDNPKKIIPAGLNCGLRAAQGIYIVRLDAHSVPAPDYVQGCIQDLVDRKGTTVGGVWTILPGSSGWLASSIAAAAAHPLGVGDALYRYASQASAVDTVPFGAYQRNLIEQIGPYDESLLTNEDYEFNTRIRQAGGTVWLDPAIRSDYFARPNLASLARQYGRYGFWKRQMLRRYARSIRWRQALPPLFVASLAALALAWLIFPAAGILLGLEVLAYELVLITAGLLLAVKRNYSPYVIGLPLAITTMHVAWGAGFLWSHLYNPKITGAAKAE